MQDVWTQAGKEAKGAMKTAFDAAAYDLVGNVWSPVEFPIDGSGKCEIVVNLIEDGVEAKDDKRRFKISMRPAMSNRSQTAKHTIDLDSISDFCKGTKLDEQASESMLVATQAMNVLLRQDVSLRYKAVGAQGRRFFGVEGAQVLPEGGVCHSGFMQSFRFTQSGHAALDTAYSAFFKSGSLIDVISEMLGMSGGGGFRGGRGGPRGGGPAPGGLQNLTEHQIRRINGLLRNAKFTLTHRKTSRLFTLTRINPQPAGEVTFLLDGKDGKESKKVSIPDYYKATYNVQVTKPRLPCVSYGAGGKNRVPLEFVRLAEFNSIPFLKLSGEQTAAMIKVAAKRPDERVKMIADWRKKLDWANLPKVKAWNVKIDPNMMQVKARILNPPVISYAGGKTQQPSGGQWNMRNTKYAKVGKKLKSWAILNLDGRLPVEAIQGFVGKLVQNLMITNCPVENQRPAIVDNADGRRFDVMQQGFACIKPGLQNAARAAFMQTQANPQLIVIILPNKDLGRYAEIKRCAMQDLRMPVVTQLLQSQKIRPDNRGMEQYIGNVSMKIHAKVGGVTHAVPSPLLDKTTMMIGADVTHPPPARGQDQVAPSIAVTVAAISGDNNLFRPEIRVQESRKESITDLQGMMVAHLNTFKKNAGSLPAKIIMFRDGVSEGQFAMCATEEYDAMLKGARQVDPKYRPKITFVICAKRHSMRFFAMQPGDGDRTGNLQPGLVVDTAVCHPFAFDFYLQAHSGLQGTARPTHYVVVKDDIGFDADKMQGLCNALCYSYSRACRSVSLIPVAYYCDIIAGKCRDFIYKEESDVAESVSSGSGPASSMNINPMELMKRIEANPDFNAVAWYM